MFRGQDKTLLALSAESVESQHVEKVNDCPKQYDLSFTHSMDVPESDFNIMLALRGVIFGFVTRVPFDDELADLSKHVEIMTSEAEWEPDDQAFSAA